jgi:repressor LexA
MVKGLTGRQKEILTFIAQQIEEEGFPPTLQEIARRFRFASVNAVRDHLAALERKGYIRRRAGASRSLALEEAARPPLGRPLVGTVPAGTPVMAEENFEGYLDLNDYFGRGEGTFLLRVRGESMIGAGIHDGDIVVVRYQKKVDPGEIGVAFIDGEATVKRIFPAKEGGFRLQPENPGMEPLHIRAGEEEFTVAGKVIGVIRRF